MVEKQIRESPLYSLRVALDALYEKDDYGPWSKEFFIKTLKQEIDDRLNK